MSERQAFLDAIVATPDDDGPRLVFADWLEEQGEGDRAEFIRLQCRLPSLGEDDPERPPVEARLAELLALRTPEWLGPDPDCVPGTPVFTRGFVEELTVGLKQLLDRGEMLFRSAP